MSEWRNGPILAVGGIVAIAFVDEVTIAVGTHSGLGVIDARTGATLERCPDTQGDYAWYQADPPAIRYASPQGVTLLPAGGLWGGQLRTTTDDGWSALATPHGFSLKHARHHIDPVLDNDEVRAVAISPAGRCAVFATSATLYLYLR